MNYLFDMDGTLTDPTQPIDPEFAEQLYEFCRRHPCYLVTGSDEQKVIKQLGAHRHWFRALFCNSGNVRMIRDGEWSENRWLLSPLQRKALEKELEKSEFWLRCGNHIEQRIGSANFSIIGRNATLEQRGYYKFWDQTHGERDAIICRLRKLECFKGVDFTMGGEISIDIYPEGNSKAQVRALINGPVTFFADKAEPGGNDYELAVLCEHVVKVNRWQDTAYYLALIG